MRLAVVLALVSSLQIFQQSSVDPDRFQSIFQFSFVTAGFPIGKFIATCVLSFHNVQLHGELDKCAKMLIFGAMISIFPFFEIVSHFLGRFLMGYSAGSGFVCAPAVLRMAVPESMRPANFLFLAAAFSIGTFLANLMFVLPYTLSPSLISALLATCSGIGYLLLRPVEYPNEECVEPNVLLCSIQSEPIKSSHPILFVCTLMILNVSVGVPLMQTYSTFLFQYYGMEKAKLLSIIWPILQFIPLFVSNRIDISRKSLILGGYYISIFTQFLILITSYYSVLPEKHQQFSMCVLLIILSVSFIIPCNTGLCIIFEQFDGGNVKTASKSRCVMWFLSSVSTLTFAKFLNSFGFTIAFLPYFLTSAISYLILIKIYPRRIII